MADYKNSSGGGTSGNTLLTRHRIDTRTIHALGIKAKRRSHRIHKTRGHLVRLDYHTTTLVVGVKGVDAVTTTFDTVALPLVSLGEGRVSTTNHKRIAEGWRISVVNLELVCGSLGGVKATEASSVRSDGITDSTRGSKVYGRRSNLGV